MARSWAEIAALNPTEPEQQLIDACRQGVKCTLGDGTRPETADPARTIRAEILRYLILGGCEDCRVHAQGVCLLGARIDGELNLNFATITGPITLLHCQFSSAVLAVSTQLVTLCLDGSRILCLVAQDAEVRNSLSLRNGFEAENGVTLKNASIGGNLACDGGTFHAPDEIRALNADSVKVNGIVLLSKGFVAIGEVNFASASIGGQLICDGGEFRNANGFALSAQEISVKGGVFFRGYFAYKNEVTKPFSSVGEVTLANAKIGGKLECDGGKFRNGAGKTALDATSAEIKGGAFLRSGFEAEGEVRFTNAMVDGQFACMKSAFSNRHGPALNAQGMTVRGGLVWRDISISAGSVILAVTKVRELFDDLHSWPPYGRLILDGFVWERLIGDAFATPADRLEWLRRGTLWEGKFSPQPYSQLAKVYRDMGHDTAARTVLVKQGQLLRYHARRDARVRPDWLPEWIKGLLHRPMVAWLWFWSFLQRAIIGYGYRPARSLGWLLALWAVAACLGGLAWTHGGMVPTSAQVLASPEWQKLADCPNPGKVWSATTGRDWEEFSPLVWGLEVAAPMLHLWQTDAWAPAPSRGIWGQVAWWGRWVIGVLGWGIAGLFAAAITGIIKRE